jgi:hypothetical protein
MAIDKEVSLCGKNFARGLVWVEWESIIEIIVYK